MKINKKNLLTNLKADVKSSETFQKEWVDKVKDYKDQTYGNPYGNEEKGKSSLVSKDIKRQLEWMLPSISDPFLSTPDVIKCNPITFEDEPSARQNELLLNTQFCRKFNRYNFIMKALRVLATEGTAVIQTGWDYEDEEIEEEVDSVIRDEMGMEHIVKEIVTTTKVIKNQPTAVVCRNEDIYIDPTCMDDMDNCQFVAHRYESSLSALRADGRYKNLDKLAGKETGDDYDYDAEDDSEFKFTDEPRKKLVVYEYWGSYDIDEDGEVEDIVCVWVGDTIIRLERNPYPDKRPPFIIVPFNAVPFQMVGEALAENIGDNQKIKTAITRGIIDNMAKSNNGQIGMHRGALDQANRKKFLQGKNFEFNGNPNEFWQGSYNQIPGSVFSMLEMMNNEIESQTGTKSFSGGISGNAIGTTATAARGAMDATAVRRLNLVRNVAENLMKPLMRKWMAYNAVFLEEEEVVRITNAEYVVVKKDDLAGRVDVEIGISTAEDNAAKSQELSFLLQTLGNTMPFEMTQMVIAEIARLSRNPQLEKMIKDYKQEPDPAQEEMKKVEIEKAKLENEKIKADIADKYARAKENGIDAEYKQWKTEYEKAKVNSLKSKTDLDDLSFIKNNEEIDYKNSVELEQMKMQHQRELAAFQAQAGDKNIGIAR